MISTTFLCLLTLPIHSSVINDSVSEDPECLRPGYSNHTVAQLSGAQQAFQDEDSKKWVFFGSSAFTRNPHLARFKWTEREVRIAPNSRSEVYEIVHVEGPTAEYLREVGAEDEGDVVMSYTFHDHEMSAGGFPTATGTIRVVTVAQSTLRQMQAENAELRGVILSARADYEAELERWKAMVVDLQRQLDVTSELSAERGVLLATAQVRVEQLQTQAQDQRNRIRGLESGLAELQFWKTLIGSILGLGLAGWLARELFRRKVVPLKSIPSG